MCLKSTGAPGFSQLTHVLRRHGPAVRGSAGRGAPARDPGGTALHPEIKYKKPHFQHNLYQDFGLYHIAYARYAMSATDLVYKPTRVLCGTKGRACAHLA
eukprot:1424297-Rhodomonas_salina.1